MKEIISLFCITILFSGCATTNLAVGPYAKEKYSLNEQYRKGEISKEEYDSKWQSISAIEQSQWQQGMPLVIKQLNATRASEQQVQAQATPASFQTNAVRNPDGSVVNYGNRQINVVNNPDGSVMITPVKKQYNEYDVYDNYGNKIGRAEQR